MPAEPHYAEFFVNTSPAMTQATSKTLFDLARRLCARGYIVMLYPQDGPVTGLFGRMRDFHVMLNYQTGADDLETLTKLVVEVEAGREPLWSP